MAQRNLGIDKEKGEDDDSKRLLKYVLKKKYDGAGKYENEALGAKRSIILERICF